MEHVPLERLFERFTEDEDPEALIARATYRFGTPQISWAKILEHRFAVVLGEAGCGKTSEFQAQTRHLKDTGRIAFFVRAEDLALENLQNAIDPGEAVRLDAWKQGDAEAVFLLDAVDEAKVTQQANAFERSLRRLRRDLGAACSRARVVVSCRISDWRHQTDLDTFKGFIEGFSPSSAAEAKGGKQCEPLIVTLARLDSPRIRVFASALDIDDIDGFMKALEEQDLDRLSGRPLDVEWLVSHWRKYRSFGTITEMLEANIADKLRERSDLRIRYDPLSLERAREGVEALAAATMLCKAFAIALPEEASLSGLTLRVVQPHRALPAWTEPEINALLNRPIFDQASRCRVRFHHRTTQEYLAASWFNRQYASGVPYRSIRDLLIREVFGATYPIPSMIPVLGWLASKIPPLRSELRASAPGVMLFFGDASQIPVEERDAALRHLTSELSGGKRLPWIIEDSDYKRLADPRLSPLILELLSSEPSSDETCRMMLRLVEAGRLADCAEAALQIALDENRNERVRVRAIRAAAAAGGPDSLELLRKSCLACAELSQSLASEFLDVLFPSMLDVDECIDIARKTASPDIGYVPSLEKSFENIVIERCRANDLPKLLEGLLELTVLPPMLEAYDGVVISRAFSWVTENIVHVLCRIKEEVHAQQMDPVSIATAYLLLVRCENVVSERTFHVEPPKQPLYWPGEINQVIFWHFVRAHPDPNRRCWWPAVGNRWFRFSSSDVAWLLEDASSVECDNERKAAFDAVLVLWHEAGRPEDVKADILRALDRTSASDHLRQNIEAQLDPPPSEEPASQRTQQLRQEERQREREAQVAKIKCDLEKRLEGLRNGTDFGALVDCYSRIRAGKGSDSSRWGQANWRALIPVFGERIAQAAREGFKMGWRTWRPALPHERQPANGIEHGVLTGLTGLRIASDEGLEFAKLTPQQAELASCYALREMNGFPDWIEELAAAHPQVLQKIMSAQIEAELKASAEEPAGGDVLSAVRYGPEIVRRLCFPVILDQLEKGRPPSNEVLRKALAAIFHVDDIAQKHLATIAAARVLGNSREDQTAMLTWLRVWLQIDAVAACDFLEQECNAEVPSEIPLFVSLAAIFGEDLQWRKDRQKPGNWPPEILERLICLSFKHIDPAQDNPPRDGLYHPNVRDRAQDFRGWLVTWLSQSPGRQAHDALWRLAGNPTVPEWMRGRFRQMVEEHAAQATEDDPWSEAQVVEFGAKHEREPDTDNALFGIVIDRICGIKDDMEGGDFSDRALFHPGLPETTMQKWLAGRLERESRGRYSIVRESEVDLNKKPDIRVHNPRAGYVSVEIKPVDDGRYTFTELKTALEQQLIGQYMRAAASRHGILVVGMLKRRKWVVHDTDRHIDFDELINKLNIHAQDLVSFSQNIEGVCVVGIDFTASKGK